MRAYRLRQIIRDLKEEIAFHKENCHNLLHSDNSPHFIIHNISYIQEYLIQPLERDLDHAQRLLDLLSQL